MSSSSSSSLQEKSKEMSELRLPLYKANFWFVILWLILLINIMDRTVINGILPALKTAFHLTDAQLGMLVSATSLGLSVFVFPFAIIADKWSRRKMISIMGALWSIATYVTGLAQVFPTLLLARLSVGIGEAAYAPAATSLISAWYPLKLRSTMIGIFQSAVILGQAGGVFLGGFLAYRYGWQSVFGILAVPGLILALLSWFIPDYKTKVVNKEKHSDQVIKPRVKDTLLYIVKTPTLLYTFLAYSGFIMAIIAFATWGSTFFLRTFNLNIEKAGMLIGLSALIQSGGAPLGGWLGDIMTRRICGGKLLVAAFVVLLFIALMSLSFQASAKGVSLTIVYLLWTVGAFISAGQWANAIAVSQDLVPPFFRAISFSLLSLTGNLLGGTLGPVITGMISDKMGLTYALQVILLLGGTIAVVFYSLAAKTFKKDLERLEKLGEFQLDRA